MSKPQFTRLPQEVFDFLERGDINKTQFIILSLLHKWADYRTGRVAAFCAERVCRYLHIETTPANLKAMRRQIAPLREMGWFHHDYEQGSKRPYNVWLHNYLPILVNDDVHDKGHGNVHDSVHENRLLNPYEIKPYQPTLDFDVREDVPEDVREFGTKLSANNLIKDAGRKTSKTNINQNATVAHDPETAQVTDLKAFIWELLEFTRPRAWASALLQKYPIDEIKHAIGEFAFSDRHSGNPGDRALAFFFKEGLEDVIRARRQREGSVDIPARRPPEHWDEVLEKLREKREEYYEPPNSDPNNSNFVETKS